MALPTLTPNQIEQIARVMGDTTNGFTGSEIGHHLAQCHMEDPDQGLTKWKRLHNAFCLAVNSSGSTDSILRFLKYCMEPAQGLNYPERYKRIHQNVNEKDAIDILTQISYLHKLLDACTTVKTAI